MINNGFTKKSGNKVIDDKHADLVAFGKLFISNPDLPTRFALNAPMADWNEDLFYASTKERYIDYPTYKETIEN